MIKLRSLIMEAKQPQVFVQNGLLWLAWGEGSGQTVKIERKGFITDKSGHKNYSAVVTGVAKWAKRAKPIKKKKNKDGSTLFLFKIPSYSKGKSYDQTNLDIWGGDEKPEKILYLLVSIGKANVMSVFHSKGEAMSWIGHTA